MCGVRLEEIKCWYKLNKVCHKPFRTALGHLTAGYPDVRTRTLLALAAVRDVFRNWLEWGRRTLSTKIHGQRTRSRDHGIPRSGSSGGRGSLWPPRRFNPLRRVGWLEVKCYRFETKASISLKHVCRLRSTPIPSSEFLVCRANLLDCRIHQNYFRKPGIRRKKGQQLSR